MAGVKKLNNSRIFKMFSPLLRQRIFRASLAFSLLAVALLVAGLFAFNIGITKKVQAAEGINETISIQGKIVNKTDGTNITDGCVVAGQCDFRVKLFSASTGGTELWTEDHLNVAVVDGIFNLRIGSVTSLSDVDLQNFNRDDLWFEIQYSNDPDSDNGFEETEAFTRTRFAAVPYALNSKYLNGKTYTDIQGEFVRINPGSAQTDASTNAMVFLNKTGASGNILQLQDNGTDAFVIDNGGNVGIGTSTPGAKLDIVGGNARMYREDGADLFLSMTGDYYGTTWSIGVEDSNNGDFIISNNLGLGTPAISITTEEDVRIGTDQGFYPLNVGQGMEIFYGTNPAFEFIGGDGMYVYDTTGTTALMISGLDDTGHNAAFDFYTNGNTTIPSFQIANTGNVGVGMAASSYRLDVNGVVRGWDLLTQDILLSSSSTSRINAYAGFDGYTNFSGGIGTAGIQRVTNTGNLVNVGSIQAGETNLRYGGTFATAVNYGTASGPMSVTMGDVNGDGKLDLISANGSPSENVSVLLNSGNGTFGSAVNYATGNGPGSAVVKDLNGDGWADIATANYNSDNISILINDRDGTFATAVNYSAGNGTRFVAVGDVNGDGKLDLGVTNSLDNNFTIFLNDGDGTFASGVNYGTSTSPRGIAIHDLNGDGWADITVTDSGTDSVSVFMNDQDGTFGTGTSYSVGTDPGCVVVGDLDGDEIPDIATSNENSDNVSVLINDGDGTFATAVNYSVSTDPRAVTINDFNGDGILDLATASSDSDYVSVLMNDGDGTFATAVNYSVIYAPMSIDSGDLNGDGALDLATANIDSNNISVLLNNSSSMFYAQASTGRVGIGTTSPGQKLTVDGTFGILEGGTTPTYHTIFQGGDQSADITYTLPTAQGGASTVLTNNGSGVLSWASTSGLEADTLATVTGRGASTSTLSTFSGGLTASGVLTFNNNAGTGTTSIGTGTTTGAVTIGGNSNTIAVNSSNWDVSSAGAISGLTGYSQSSGNFSISGAGTFGTGTGAISLNGATTVADGSAFNAYGNTTLGNATTDTITFTGRVNSTINPSANDTYNLGSDALRWANLYLGPETLYIGTGASDQGTISYDTTNNDFLIQTDGTMDLVLQGNGGSVGIGTTAPASLLHVYNPSNYGYNDSLMVSSLGTTNLGTNPSVETNATTWSVVGTGSTISRSTAQSRFGAYSVMVSNGSSAYAGVQYYSQASPMSISSSTDYSASVYVYRTSTDAPIRLYVRKASDNTVIASSSDTTQINGWERLTVTFNTGTETGVFFQIIKNNDTDVVTYYVDGIQIEQTSQVTSYCDGSLGTGYSWSGTAHASTSTRVVNTIYTDEIATLTKGLNVQGGSYLNGSLSLLESAGSQYYTTFQGGDQSANIVYTLPTSQGAANSMLTNNGSGTLSWVDPSGTGALGYWTRTGTTLFPTNSGDDISTTGQMALGSGSAINASYALNIQETWDDWTGSGDRYGIRNYVTASETSYADYGSVYGTYSRISNTSTMNQISSGIMRGVYGAVGQNGTGTLGQMRAVQGYAYKTSGGTVDVAYGGMFSVAVGTATTQYGVYGSDGTTIGYLGYNGTYGLYTGYRAYISSSTGTALNVNSTTGNWTSFQYNGAETLSITDNATNIVFATPDVVTDRGFAFNTWSGEKVRITNGGIVGIGNPAPDASLLLDVSGRGRMTGGLSLGDAPADSTYPLRVDLDLTDSTSGSGGIYNNTEVVNTTNTANNTYGYIGYLYISPNTGITNSSTLNSVYSALGFHNGAGTADSLIGYRSQIGENSTGSLGTGYGFYADCNDATTCYGLYISGGDAEVTNDWGVYVTGEDDNYFSGNVGIGTTAPQQKLQVAGAAYLTYRTAPTGVGVTCSSSGGTLPDATYYYRVSYVSNGVESNMSSEASGTVSGGGGAGSCTVSWTDISGITSYRIYRGTVSNTQIEYYTDDASSFVDTGATASTGSPSYGTSLRIAGSEITTANDRFFPHLILDSTSSGGTWAQQGAYISIGEDASNLDLNRSLQLVYRGDNYGYVGGGALSTSGVPAYSYFRFDTDAKDIYSDSEMTFSGNYSGDIVRYGVLLTNTINNSVALTAARTHYGLYSRVDTGNNNLSTYTQSLIGVYGAARSITNSGANVSSATGVYGFVDVVDGATITTARGLYSNVNQTSGTITNGYGLYIDDIVATNDYGVYQSAISDTNYFAGSVGIGDTSPAALFTVGSGDLFRVDSSGDLIRINNVAYSWPSAQGATNSTLVNNGSGTLSWSSVSGLEADTLATVTGRGASTSTLSTFSGGLTASGVLTFNNNASTGTTNIGTGTTTGAVTIGGNSNTIAVNSSNWDVSSAGAISGLTGYSQSSGNFSISGTGTFGTGTGAISLNGATTVADSRTFYAYGNTELGNTTSDTITFTGRLSGDFLPVSSPTSSVLSRANTQVSDTDNVGHWTSVAIGTDGYPVISYRNVTDGDLMVYKCSNASCSSGSSTQITDTNSVGYWTSIAIGTDGYPVISYQSSITPNVLTIYKCSNASCSSGSYTDVTHADNIGDWTSIAIGTDGYPVISYQNTTDGDLMVYKCSNASCSSGSSTQITNTDDVGSDTSLVIGRDGYPVISYYNSTDGDLMVYKCSNASCSSGSSTQMTDADSVGQYASIAIETDGYPVISYYNSTDSNLMVYKCSNISCSSGSSAQITDASSIGQFSSMKIGTDGYPVISGSNAANLMVYKCSNASCSSGSKASITSTDNIGYYTSIAIGVDGYPVVAHYNSTDGDLMILKCVDESCSATSGVSYSGGSDLGSSLNFFNNVYATNYWAKDGINVNNFDLAEDYEVQDLSIAAGDVVALTNGTNISIGKTSEKYQSDVIGVVSTSPGLKLSDWTVSEEARQSMRPIALSGRVPVKVTTENGEIKKGDKLVPASTPGYAMKACGTKYCEPGMSIGIALEDFLYEQSGDSVEVVVNIESTVEEVQKNVDVQIEQLESTLDDVSSEEVQQIQEQIDSVEAVSEQVEKLAQDSQSDNLGEGRIMMFVNLTSFIPLDLITGEHEISTLKVKDAEFTGNIVVKKHVAFGEDTVGYVRILAGASEATVIFTEEYKYQPVVTVTPRGETMLKAGTLYSVVDENTTGFTVRLNQVQDADVEFSWHAFGADNGKITISDGSTQIISIKYILGLDQKLADPLASPTCEGYVFTQAFSEEHRGIDLAKRGGCVISAIGSGTVIYAGDTGEDPGYMVTVDHGNGVISRYLHGDGTFFVEVGQRVTQGQELMMMGDTGNSTGVHLHFSLMVDGIFIDPTLYVPINR